MPRYNLPPTPPKKKQKQKKTSVYDLEILQSHTAVVRKSQYQSQNTRETKQGKATSSFFPTKMIVKIERSQSGA